MAETPGDVNAINWDANTGNLAVGSVSAGTVIIDGVAYGSNRAVTSMGTNQYRQVSITVNYPIE